MTGKCIGFAGNHGRNLTRRPASKRCMAPAIRRVFQAEAEHQGYPGRLVGERIPELDVYRDLRDRLQYPDGVTKIFSEVG